MKWQELRDNRQAAIERLEVQIQKTESLGLPYWLLVLLVILMFLLFVLLTSLKLGWALIVGWGAMMVSMFVAPFQALWLLSDLCIITWWFLIRLVEKSSGRLK